ncbi:MAG TPA: oligosaccharide flippase family protein [Kofleriaceae bacterium]|nr:oligosaccharide flippase family protein [Kofleriaceae bacterium]
MDSPSLTKTIDHGLAWVATATALVAVCDVVALALILHLWLDATAFGVVSAVVTVFPALTLLAELGLPAALIQGAEPDDTRLSTAFYLTVAAGLALYAAVVLLAPVVAAAQGQPQMTRLFQVGGLMLVIRPAYLMHRALLRRQLRFQELSVIRMIANLVELVVKLGVAAAGHGLWCLVVAPLARELVYALAIPTRLRWRPRLLCAPRRCGADLRFGLRTSSGEILFHVYSNLDYQIVSAYFGATALGLYRAAFELVIEPVRFVSEVVTVVAFPAFARLRHDRGAVTSQLVKFARHNVATVLPMVALIVVAASELLTVIIGPAYAPAATAARVLAVVGVLRALSHLGPPLLDGLGRPELTLRYHVIAALVLGVAFVVAGQSGQSLGYLAVALAWAAGYPLAFAALAFMVLGQLDLPVAKLARPLARIGALVLVAALVGGLVAASLPETLGPLARLGVLTVVVLGLCGALLIWAGELSPRALAGAIRRSPKSGPRAKKGRVRAQASPPAQRPSAPRTPPSSARAPSPRTRSPAARAPRRPARRRR